MCFLSNILVKSGGFGTGTALFCHFAFSCFIIFKNKDFVRKQENKKRSSYLLLFTTIYNLPVNQITQFRSQIQSVEVTRTTSTSAKTNCIHRCLA